MSTRALTWLLCIMYLLAITSSLPTTVVQYYAQVYMYTESYTCDNNLHAEIIIVPLNKCILVSSEQGKSHYVFYKATRVTVPTTNLLVTNIVMTHYEHPGDSTCSIEDIDTRTYHIAQFTENLCQTKTATLPYRSVLGTSTATAFPSFSNGILYKYYGTTRDCVKDTEKNLAGIFWTDFNCKTASRSIKPFCYLGEASYNKYTDNTCSGASPIVHPIKSSCDRPVRTGFFQYGFLAHGLLYDYLLIECMGGLAPPVIQPTLKPYPVQGPTIAWCFSAWETVQTEAGGIMPISKVKVGDRLLAFKSYGAQLVYATVVAVPHPENFERSVFIELRTDDNHSLRVTTDHLLPIFRTCTQEGDVKNVDHLPLVAANDVQVGDCLVTMNKKFTRVRELETYLGEGVYTFILDEAEFLVVNNLIASPFGVNHKLANLYYEMYRFVHMLLPQFTKYPAIEALTSMVTNVVTDLASYLLL